MERRYFVYIMSNESRMLYVGVTNGLHKRVFQHKSKLIPGFT
ncbi:MAG TPA: GIY-YIG nuclease family protein [Candidatus Limnocylindrales bacterium]|nr:GIY-YIG nuclease family protein [Candidatus Limnocylindrales bacterium]